jgi:hypothetical protein
MSQLGRLSPSRCAAWSTGALQTPPEAPRKSIRARTDMPQCNSARHHGANCSMVRTMKLLLTAILFSVVCYGTGFTPQVEESAISADAPTESQNFQIPSDRLDDSGVCESSGLHFEVARFPTLFFDPPACSQILNPSHQHACHRGTTKEPPSAQRV